MNKDPLIIIVDDDNAVRGALESFVTSHGFQACTFASANAFLQSSLVSETSCLISDVQMSDIDGVELQNRLINLGLSIPTIFITAHPNDEIRTRVLNAGAICILYKPFDLKALLRCIEDALNRGSRKAHS